MFVMMGKHSNAKWEASVEEFDLPRLFCGFTSNRLTGKLKFFAAGSLTERAVLVRFLRKALLLLHM